MGLTVQHINTRLSSDNFTTFPRTIPTDLNYSNMKLLMLTLLVAALAGIATAAKYTGPTNQAGVNLIKEFEGFVPNFYTDPVGIKTIGYGHGCHVYNCKVPLNGRYSVPLTRASGEALLKEDLGSYERCVRNAVKYGNLNANQYSALVSFTFNLGCGSLQSSTLLRKLNGGDVKGAADEFPRWVYAGGKVLPGLVRRRNAERSLFCTGGTCGGSGGGGGGGTCTGKVNTSAGLNVRSSASTSASVVRSLAAGSSITITGRVTGTSVNGNNRWFKVSGGYVSAYYITISSSNGASYCSK